MQCAKLPVNVYSGGKQRFKGIQSAMSVETLISSDLTCRRLTEYFRVPNPHRRQQYIL